MSNNNSNRNTTAGGTPVPNSCLTVASRQRAECGRESGSDSQSQFG